MSIRCGNHKRDERVVHATVADVAACFAARYATRFDTTGPADDDAAERADAIAGPTETLADLVGTGSILDRLARAGAAGQDYRARAAELARAYRRSGARHA